LSRTLTPFEVQALIPELELICGRLVWLRGELRRRTPDGADLPDPNHPEITSLIAEADRLIGRIADLGGQLKSAERGLIDFACQRGDEVVLLCWQLGEKRLAWWHGMNEGFAGRKSMELEPGPPAELLN